MQPSPTVAELVDRWVAAGIITADQAQRIHADLALVLGGLALVIVAMYAARRRPPLHGSSAPTPAE
jgi:hypothetical protein